MNRITYYSGIDDYAKFIEELKKINFLYAKYVECKQKKSIFRGLITYNRLPGNTIRKIDDIYAKRDDGNDKNSKYSDTRNKLFYEIVKFLTFFNPDIDVEVSKEENWYDYSEEILEKLNTKLEKKSCQLPNNVNLNNLGVQGNTNEIIRRVFSRRANNNRGSVFSRRANNNRGSVFSRRANNNRGSVFSRRANNNRSNGSNLRARRSANSRTRRNESARLGIPI